MVTTTQVKTYGIKHGSKYRFKCAWRADLAVGDKIQITLPITGKSHVKDDLEKFYEGEFLVTHLKHIFDGNPKTHMIEMSVAQDSTPQSYEVVADAKEPKIEGTINKV